MAQNRSSKVLVDLFSAKTVVDLPAIQSTLEGASAMTAFRYLRQIPYRSSYNHNGRYYSLFEPARYDHFGLWTFKGIHFSVDGSLNNTVRRMVHEALAGATHRELQLRLQVRVQNTLVTLLRREDVHRQQIDGVYVYLHTEPSLREAQLAQRRQQIAASKIEAEVTHPVVIEVLLTLIRHPASKAADVVRHLRGHSPAITMQHVRFVFKRYDLDKVGKKGGASNC